MPAPRTTPTPAAPRLAPLPPHPLAPDDGNGSSMHIADVDKGMLGANGIGTLAVAIGQIAAVSTGYGPVTIARQGQQNIGDVTVGISSSATTGAVTGNVSKAIASLGKA